MKKSFLYVLFVVIFSGLAITAQADTRLDAIAQAWNAGNIEATQSDFDRAEARSMAEMAVFAETGGKVKITKVVQLMPDVIGAQAEINSEPHVWLLREKDGKFTGFWHKPVSQIASIGGMDYGQGFDVATTVVGLGQGFAEGNPFGLVGAGIYKATFLIGSRYSDFENCVPQRAAHDMWGWGAGAKNIALMAGVAEPATWALMVAIAITRYEPAHETAAFECASFALNRDTV